MKQFLEGQGYRMKANFIEQDNQSAIKLATNGLASTGQRSRHVNIRYFWVKDRIKSDDLTVRYCETERMLADFLSKPLQGSLFRKFKKVLLGHEHISTLRPISAPPEERVGGHEEPGRQNPETYASVVRQGPRRPHNGRTSVSTETTTSSSSHSME